MASRRLSFMFAYVSRIASRLSCLSYVVFRLPCDLGLFSLFLSCLEVSCVSSIILHACSLGCGLFLSFFFLVGVCFWSFRFARCGASGRVGASALSLCCVLACVVSFVAPSWQEGGDIYVLRNDCQYFFAFFLFVRMFF